MMSQDDTTECALSKSLHAESVFQHSLTNNTSKYNYPRNWFEGKIVKERVGLQYRAIQFLSLVPICLKEVWNYIAKTVPKSITLHRFSFEFYVVLLNFHQIKGNIFRPESAKFPKAQNPGSQNREFSKSWWRWNYMKNNV